MYHSFLSFFFQFKSLKHPTIYLSINFYLHPSTDPFLKNVSKKRKGTQSLSPNKILLFSSKQIITQHIINARKLTAGANAKIIHHGVGIRILAFSFLFKTFSDPQVILQRLIIIQNRINNIHGINQIVSIRSFIFIF